MTRKFDGDTLVVASHNKGKVREIAALLGPYVATFRSAAELDLPEPEETGDTFIANAELKARAAAHACGLIALSDDSGLVVPAIGGQPGIYSARWAGADKDFPLAMERVNRELGDGDRTRLFRQRADAGMAGRSLRDRSRAGFMVSWRGRPGRQRVRLRPDVHSRWLRHHLRRDGLR